jgi:hypothetical protein
MSFWPGAPLETAQAGPTVRLLIGVFKENLRRELLGFQCGAGAAPKSYLPGVTPFDYDVYCTGSGLMLRVD